MTVYQGIQKYRMYDIHDVKKEKKYIFNFLQYLMNTFYYYVDMYFVQVLK